MRLITLIAAMLGVAAVLGALVSESARGGFQRGLVLMACSVGLMLVATNAWSTTTNLRDRYRANEGLSSQAATTAGGRHVGVQADFVEWARAQLRDGDSYYLMPSGHEKAGEASYQWTTFRLLPHVSVPTQGEADVLVFYGVRPGATDYPREEFESPVRFSKDFGIARRVDAG